MNPLALFGQFFLELLRFVYSTIGFQNLGVAVIEIAVLSRLILYPFIKQQTHYSKKMSELQPHLNELKAKHKGDKQAFAQAQMALFKEHGVNPAAGCLPSIVQMVVMIGLYSAIGQLVKEHGINLQFFSWNMAHPDLIKIPVALPLGLKGLPGILVIFSAATQFIQTKMMLPSAPNAPQNKALVKKDEEKKSDFMGEFAEAQSSMVWMFPLMFLFIGLSLPSALALYWSVSSAIMIGQQYRIAGLGGLAPYVVKLKALYGTH